MKYPIAVSVLAAKLVKHCQKEISFAADSQAKQAWSALVGQATANLADVQGGLPGADVRVTTMAASLKVA